MTKDEALKRALEALNLNATMSIMEWHNQRNEAITAIKQALAAHVQEPVAWMLPDTDSFLTAASKVHHGIRAESYTIPLYTTPPAAQRQALRADTWGGLTQQDIDIAFDDTREGGGFDDFARAIEAKLKAKNSP